MSPEYQGSLYAMELFWRVTYCVGMGLVAYLLHRVVGRYPKQLPGAEDPKGEILQALVLWGIAIVFPILMIYVISPWLNQVAADATLRELFRTPLLSLPYIALPLFIVLKLNRWTIKDIGLTWKVQSGSVAAFAVIFGLVTGSIAFVANQAVVSIEPLPAGVLLLLLYNNSFIEEFYHRGVIQSKLERTIGQKKAVLWGGILFGLTHVVFDISSLLVSGGALVVFLTVLTQTMAGWILGIIYMKTRSLWPGTLCHYFGNWLPSILAGLLG
jgi:membrane protease YdiL (CAAX protease family)